MLLVLGAQAIALGIGLIKALVLPAAMSVEDFAYWQLYILYSGFVGVCSFGYTDGVYLLYGATDYRNLPFERLRGANRVYISLLVAISLALGCCALLWSNASRSFVFAFVAIDVLVICLSGLCTYVLQITNQFRRYSFCTVIDKIAFIGASVALILFDVVSFSTLIIVDVVTKVAALAFFVWYCRDVFFGRAIALVGSVREALTCARTGVSLLFANFSGMLISNLGRFLVDQLGSLVSYACYSFGSSVTNLVLSFVTAASAVIYPKLKRVSDDDLGKYYSRIDRAMLALMFVGLLVYFPAFWAIGYFYEKYSPMLNYLNMMFISAVYQAKMGVLVNTYYKTLRLERRMLCANVECLAVFAVMAGVSFWLTRDVWWIAVSTVVAVGLRCVLSEIEIRRRIGVRSVDLFVAQCFLVVSFLILTLMLSTWTAALTFLALGIGVCLLVIFKKRRAA